MKGRELWVMVVSASPYEHMIGKPNVKYVANMHGELELLFNAIFNIFYFFLNTFYFVRPI